MGTFTLDASTLGTPDLNYIETPVEGRGRTIKLEWNQPGSNQDLKILGYAVRHVPAEIMAQEQA